MTFSGLKYMYLTKGSFIFGARFFFLFRRTTHFFIESMRSGISNSSAP